MNKLLSLFLLFLGFTAMAQQSLSDFVFTVQTYRVGNSGDSSFTIHVDSNYVFNYDVDWDNDGIYDTLGLNDSLLINYPDTGTYTIRIRGQFPSIKFGTGSFRNYRESRKLISIDQWGDQAWLSLENAFNACSNLSELPIDTPDLSNSTSLKGTFSSSGIHNGVSHWNTSTIIDMSYLFNGCDFFNDSLNSWNVSKVTDMNGMFLRATSFNQPLNNWDVSSVQDMSNMFAYTDSFNVSLSSWEVSDVINMSNMFSSAKNFNQPLNSWDVSSVQNMSGMFVNAYRFDQAIDNWDVSKVTSMQGMFGGAIFFDQAVNNWDVSSVRDMQSMFRGAVAFNRPLDNWDVSNVTNMSHMFEASTFNQNINNWDVSSVTRMQAMFRFDTSFNQPLNNWDVSSVENMLSMFEIAYRFNQNLNSWDVSSVKIMSTMFSEAIRYDQAMNQWNTSSVVSMRDMFYFASAFDQPIHMWDFGQLSSNGFGFNFLSYSNLSFDNYDSLIFELFGNHGSPARRMGAVGIQYCQSKIVRDTLINQGWTFLGDVLKFGCEAIGIDELSLRQRIKFHPNPTASFVFMEDLELDARIQLFINSGQMVMESRVDQSQLSLDVSSLPNGVYLLRVGEVSERLVIER